MVGQVTVLPAGVPFRCSRGCATPRIRVCTPICSVLARPDTARAATALAFREDVLKQPELGSVGSRAYGGGAAPLSASAVAERVQHAGAAGSASSSSSPWQQQAPSAASDAAELEARLMAAGAQAAQRAASQSSQLQQGSAGVQPPARRRQVVSRASAEGAARAGQHALQQSQSQPQPQRRRTHPPNGLQRSGRAAQPGDRPAPLQTAVRSNKQHDWQVRC